MMESFFSLFGEGKRRKLLEELNFLKQQLDRLLIQQENHVRDCVSQAFKVNVAEQIVDQYSLHIPVFLPGEQQIKLPNLSYRMVNRTPRFGKREVVGNGRQVSEKIRALMRNIQVLERKLGLNISPQKPSFDVLVIDRINARLRGN